MVDDAVEAATDGGLDVERHVVDEHALLGPEAELLQEPQIDPRLRLDQVAVGGDELSVKELQGGDALPEAVEAGAGVGQQIDAVPLALELPHQLVYAVQRGDVPVPVV